MDDLFLDGQPPYSAPSAVRLEADFVASLKALGITAEVEAKGLKGSKRKKALKLGEDYTVRPRL